MEQDDYDFWVNPTEGTDTGDGSEEAPFSSLLQLFEVLEAERQGEKWTAFIGQGHYIDQHLDLGFFRGTVELTFEEGTIIEWTEGTSRSGIQAVGEGTHSIVNGNGLIIRGFDTGTGNGIGTFAGTIIAHDVVIENVRDGISAHSTGHLEAYNVTVTEAHKFAVAHVNQSTSYHEDCYFRPSNDAVGIGFFDPGGSHVFVRSVFEASPDGSKNAIDVADGLGLVFIDCVLGTPEVAISLSAMPMHIFGMSVWFSLMQRQRRLCCSRAQREKIIWSAGRGQIRWSASRGMTP